MIDFLRLFRSALAGALVTFGAAGAARADSLVSLPEPDYAAPARTAQIVTITARITALVYPTIGAPAIVEPGGRVGAVILLDDGGVTADWRAAVETSADPVPQHYALARTGTASFDAKTKTYRVEFVLPAALPEDTYDLSIASAHLPGGGDRQPNAVRVLRPRQDYVFAHIADTQIRDPNTQFPQKFMQVLYELRLRDPAFTIFSGDLNFGDDYTLEYPETWQIMQQGGVSLSCVPGNHDGYAWTIPQTGALDYDGLNFWRRVIGPLYYSFRVGTIRVIAANGYDGPAARRNSLAVLSVNSGGQIDPPQLAWIEQEAKAASAAGEEMLIHLHQTPDPSRAITPNVTAFPWDVSNVGAGNGLWNDPVSQAEIQRITTQNAALNWIFAGHTHADQAGSMAVGSRVVRYVTTTSVDCRGSPYDGYRLVKVKGGRVSEVDRPGTGGSYEFPLGANLFADFQDPNDGSQASVRCNAQNRLTEPVDMTLKFALRADPRGFLSSQGLVRDVGLAASGAAIVYVRVTVPAAATLLVTAAPDPSGHGVQPRQTQSPAAAAPGPSAGRGPVSGGGGGGGCAFAPGGDSAWLLPLAALALLLLRRRFAMRNSLSRRERVGVRESALHEESPSTGSV